MKTPFDAQFYLFILNDSLVCSDEKDLKTIKYLY